MSEQLHKIDRPGGKYRIEELQEVMVFCILDTSVPYEKCCQAFDALKKSGLTKKKGLRQASERDIMLVLKQVGYRWANQKARYLKEFAKGNVDIKHASREELVKDIKGIGMKLASMFLRNTRGKKYAVLDVHTLRWLQKNYNFSDEEFKKMSYQEKEKHFIRAAEFLSTTTMELDLKIWNENRIGNRRR